MPLHSPVKALGISKVLIPRIRLDYACAVKYNQPICLYVACGGTVLVKNINPGSASSSPGNLINASSTLYFTADDGTNGVELWKSDGTDVGTVMVKNIAAGAASS